MPKVYISPSTQEHNSYINGGTEEQWMNKVGDVVVSLLQFNHFEVYRNNPNNTLQQAVTDSNNKNVDIHFAIHSNAGGGTARGGEVFYVSANGHKLADAVYKYLELLTPTGDRGVKLNEHLYELNQTKAVAALVEVMFHDNIEDANFIISHIQALGEAIYHGICDYFNIEFKLPQVINNYSGSLIKIGSKGANVKLIQSKLNALGFPCGSVDGIFGNKTLTAVKAFQRVKGLSVDGIIGLNTWNKLFN